MPGEAIRYALEGLALETHSFGRELAFQAGLPRPSRSRGLSLGDRACLALGQQLALPVLTANRAWEGLDLETEVKLVRS